MFNRFLRALTAGLCFAGIACAATSGPLALVENGVSRAPIVVFENAPPLTRQAADELAYYLEKTSGARPEVLEGRPDPVPEHAIWVGYQPVLEELFPELDFDFQHPGEILIAANDRHLVIAGRDRWNPEHLDEGIQHEYGTHNAVYTFLQDSLGVRWLWPGALGEDILERETVAFEPFTTRYHPRVLSREGLLAYSLRRPPGEPGGPEQRISGQSGYWLRAQRLMLGELNGDFHHGPWGRWWDRFHKTHPEYFALQADGTRGGGETPFPSKGNIKMCVSNPDLARQVVEDIAAELKTNPNKRVFSVGPGDSHAAGHCLCEDCLAWDHPDGAPRGLRWRGSRRMHVALSDREVTFANRVARMLRERFPDRELYVSTLAYGPSRPAPVEAAPDDNVIISNVANFLLRPERTHHRENFADWGRVTDGQFFRPNVGSDIGFQHGAPDVRLRQAAEDLQFAAEHGMIGIFVDFVRENWATQGPLYYLMGQLLWDPSRDAEDILEDYYRRAFGPAAEAMAAYWSHMDRISEEIYQEAVHDRKWNWRHGYSEERLAKAGELLDAAKTRLGSGDDRYRARIAFVEAGLEFMQLLTESSRLVQAVNRDEDPEGQARAKVHANWDRIRALRDEHPGAIRWTFYLHRGDDSVIRSWAWVD